MSALQDKVCAQRQGRASFAMEMAQAHPIGSDTRGQYEREGYFWLAALAKAQAGDLTPVTIPTPGQLAYMEDVRRRPTYHTGEARHTWDQLGAAVRDNWERYPTPRDFDQVNREAMDSVTIIASR